MLNLLLENLNIQIVLIFILALVSYFSYKYKPVKLVSFIVSLGLLNFMFYQEFLIKNPQGIFLLVFALIAIWVNFCLYLFFYKNSYKSISLRILYVMFLFLIKYLNLDYFKIEEANFLFTTDLTSNHFYLFLNYVIYLSETYSFFQLVLFLIPGALSLDVFLESQDLRMYMLKNTTTNMDKLIIKIKEHAHSLQPSKILLPKLDVTPEFITKNTPFALVAFEPIANKTSLNGIFKFNSQNNGFIKYFQELARDEESIAFLEKHLPHYRNIPQEAYFFKRLVVPFSTQLNFHQLEICFQIGYKDASPSLVRELLKSLQMTTIIDNGIKLQRSEINYMECIKRLESDKPISKEIASLRTPNNINSITQAQTISSNLLACESVLKEEGIEVEKILQSDLDFFIIAKNGEKIKFEVKTIHQIYNKKGFRLYLDGAFSKYIKSSPSSLATVEEKELITKKLIVACDSTVEPTSDMQQVIDNLNIASKDKNHCFYLKKL